MGPPEEEVLGKNEKPEKFIIPGILCSARPLAEVLLSLPPRGILLKST